MPVSSRAQFYTLANSHCKLRAAIFGHGRLCSISGERFGLAANCWFTSLGVNANEAKFSRLNHTLNLCKTVKLDLSA